MRSRLVVEDPGAPNSVNAAAVAALPDLMETILKCIVDGVVKRGSSAINEAKHA